MRDVEAVAADPIRPTREGGGGRIRDNAIVLQRAEGYARRRIPLDVEIVEQGGLQAASVERREGGAAGAFEDPTVIAAIDDRERTRLRHERPRVVVGVQSAQRRKGQARIRRARLTDSADIDDIVDPVSRRGGVDGHVKAIPTLCVERHAADAWRNTRVVRRLQCPGETLIGAPEDSDRIRCVGRLRGPVERPSLHRGVQHLDASRCGRRGWRRQRDDELPDGASGTARRPRGVEFVRDHRGRAAQDGSPGLPAIVGSENAVAGHTRIQNAGVGRRG